MGTYLNPGRVRYQMAVNSEIFIDKSEMILYLNSVINTNQRFVSVSRPRRFGKTMAADMLCAYYGQGSDSRPLFKKCSLARTENGGKEPDWDDFLGKFDVIRLAMTDFFNKDNSVDSALTTIRKRILDELEEEYPETKYDEKDFYYS